MLTSRNKLANKLSYVSIVLEFQYKLFLMLEQQNMALKEMQCHIDRLTASNSVAAGQPLPSIVVDRPCSTRDELMDLETKISSLQERETLVSNFARIFDHFIL